MMGEIDEKGISAFWFLKDRLFIHHQEGLRDEDDVQAYSKQNDFLEGIDQPKKKKSLYYPIRQQYKPRVNSLGFSITPPPGVNWYEKFEEDSLSYIKIDRDKKQYSLLTEAREVRLQREVFSVSELRNYVQREKEHSLSSSHLKNLRVATEIQTSPAKKCIRYRQTYRDYGLKGLRRGQYVHVDTHGLFCLHPESSIVGVDMRYIEKSLSDTAFSSFSGEGEKFLSSLTFQELKR